MVFGIAALLAVTGCGDDEGTTGPVATESAELLAVAGSNTVSMLDLEQGVWVPGTFGVGSGANDVITEGADAWVVCSSSNDLHAYSHNGESVAYEGSADLGIASGNNPWEGALTGNGRMLVTNWAVNTVSVFDLASGQIDTTWTTGDAPAGVLVRGSRAYVIVSAYDLGSYTFHEGSVMVHDLTTGAVLDTIPVGVNPQYAAFDASGRLHVACTGNYGDVPGAVWVVDPSTGTKAGEVATGGTPGRIAVSGDGTVWVAGGGFVSEGVVYSYSAATLGGLDQVATTLGASDVVIGTDGAVYVLCQGTPYPPNNVPGAVEKIVADTVAVSWAMPNEDSPLAFGLWTPPVE